MSLRWSSSPVGKIKIFIFTRSYFGWLTQNSPLNWLNKSINSIFCQRSLWMPQRKTISMNLLSTQFMNGPSRERQSPWLKSFGTKRKPRIPFIAVFKAAIPSQNLPLLFRAGGTQGGHGGQRAGGQRGRGAKYHKDFCSTRNKNCFFKSPSISSSPPNFWTFRRHCYYKAWPCSCTMMHWFSLRFKFQVAHLSSNKYCNFSVKAYNIKLVESFGRPAQWVHHSQSRGHSTTMWTEFWHFLTSPAWTVFIP